MRQKIASDIIRNIGTGKWCETAASINYFRSYESKEVKKIAYMILDEDEPFQCYKSDEKEEKQIRRKYLIPHLAT